MKRFAALLIAAVVLAALFAGCSSSKKVKVIDIKLTDEEPANSIAKATNELN
jgi:predicted component of type VI protein secretion system